jgi:hypothetical protein
VLAASALLAVFLIWSAGSVNWTQFEGGRLLARGAAGGHRGRFGAAVFLGADAFGFETAAIRPKK